MATENPTMQLDPKYDHYDFPTTAPTPKNGHPGHTTPEQDAQVYQLRMKLEAAGYTDRLDTLTLVSTSLQLALGIFKLIRGSASISACAKVRCCPHREDVGFHLNFPTSL
jgi:hypothetical protein